MAEVVLAEHLGLGKLVAVKLLREEYAKDAMFATRMQIEARSVAALASPHIVQVTDIGQTATGRTYIVMERLSGVTLSTEMKGRRALPVVEAIDYVVQVLAGLGAAHAMGIIHRDIKAENVFLCDATKDTPRTVKILDFGIAKVLDVSKEVVRPALPHLVTAEGGIVGTPRMIAPEQALGKTVDERTDIYATGLLLYALIAGRGPFAHLKDAGELLVAHVRERPARPSTQTENHIPPALDAAILRALEKRPADRFPSAAAFARELRDIAAEVAPPGTGTPVTTGPLPTAVAPASDEDERRDDPTVQLAGAKVVDAANPSEPEPAGPTTTPPIESCIRAAGTPCLAAHSEGCSPSALHRAPVRWTTFLALTMLSTAVSALLLFGLSRATP